MWATSHDRSWSHISWRCTGVVSIIVFLSAGRLTAEPQLDHVVRGDVTLSRDGNRTLIEASHNSIINFKRFDIGRPETVQFLQPGPSARLLSRVTGINPTRIDGTLRANGHVYLVNPAGIYFGNTAVVDVGAIHAAAATLTNTDFLNHVDLFTNVGGPVINEGSIDGALVQLIGSRVVNFGSVVSPDGIVTMAAGDEVYLAERDGRVMAKIEGFHPTASPAVDNAGTLQAGAGSVNLSAGDMYALAIRHTGQIKAKTIQLEGGRGGDVQVNGQLDASVQDNRGGSVQILGERVVLEGASVDASGDSGGGTILIGGDFQGGGDVPTASRTFVDHDTTITANALNAGDGGRVIVWADQLTRFTGSISARGGHHTGSGGFAEVSSQGALQFRGDIDLSAANGVPGTLLLDPFDMDVSILDGTDGANGGTVDFADNPAAEPWNVTPAQLDAVGGSITLRVNNNLTITDAVNLSTAGANLTLQAGDDLLVNADLTTNNGAIALTANDPGGSESAGGTAGVITMAWRRHDQWGNSLDYAQRRGRRYAWRFEHDRDGERHLYTRIDQ